MSILYSIFKSLFIVVVDKVTFFSAVLVWYIVVRNNRREFCFIDSIGIPRNVRFGILHCHVCLKF